MALTIANNVASLNAQTNLNKASNAVAKSVERLSSGLKINRGADGPAALVISEKQRAQIAGLKAAIDNSEKAVSLVQTAEGALTEINSLLVKVRTLSVDSANAGVNDTDALAANQSEIDNALDTISRIANNTQFGTKKLLDGSAAGAQGVATNAAVTVDSVTTAATAGDQAVNVTTAAERANVSTASSGATTQTADTAGAETLTINTVDISLTAGLDQSEVAARINEFTEETGVIAEVIAGETVLYTEDFGDAAEISVQSNVTADTNSSGFGTTALTDTGVDIEATVGEVAIAGVGNTLTGTTGAPNGLVLTIAESATDVLSSETGDLGTVAVSKNELVFQIGANKDQTAAIEIQSTTASGLGVGITDNQFANLSEIDITTASGAQDAIEVIDGAIDDITNLRGTLGAFQQNTLESTANNLRATLENSINAESVIRDTDFAEEIANFTKNQVLLQAGTSVLGNANQLPQAVLSLLG